MREHEEALRYIDVSLTNREVWRNVGMALKDLSKTDSSVTWEIWDKWSREDTRDKKYPGSAEIKKQWDSFTGMGITVRTLYWYAIQGGYQYSQRSLDWEDEISFDGEPVFFDPWEEAYRYLKALFLPEEYISYNFDLALDDKDGRYKPNGQGHKALVSELLEKLKQRKPFDEIFTSYNKEAGGLIIINPLDDELGAIKHEHVTDYRYCLIESDELSIADQFKKIVELKLPCAALVDSGNKSIHAIVHVDAKDYEEYRKRVNWIYKVLEEHDFPVDKNNKNPNRYTRLPGLLRGDKYQSLIEYKSEYKDFASWEDFILNGPDDILPDIVSYAEIIDNPPPLKEELIEGVLRQGHKMIIAGASKSGKSFSLIDLMCCIAEGEDWLGFKCKKGRVLYLNFEIDEASFWERIRQVYEKHNWKATPKNIDVWNLRGHSMPAAQLVPKVIRRVRDKDYSLIILDPIYKIQAGDENAAGDIARFTNEVDRLANELGASVVYCHHHSKGQQGFKRSMDRASGSGVFSRDPDAILDVIELADDCYKMTDHCDQRAFRIEGTLREFPAFEPVNVFYDFPIYVPDDTDMLASARPKDEAMSERQNGKSRKKPSGPQRLIDTLTRHGIANHPVKIEAVLVDMGIKKDRLKQLISETNKEAGKKLYSVFGDKIIQN